MAVRWATSRSPMPQWWMSERNLLYAGGVIGGTGNGERGGLSVGIEKEYSHVAAQVLADRRRVLRARKKLPGNRCRKCVAVFVSRGFDVQTIQDFYFVHQNFAGRRPEAFGLFNTRDFVDVTAKNPRMLFQFNKSRI